VRRFIGYALTFLGGAALALLFGWLVIHRPAIGSLSGELAGLRAELASDTAS
jgi:hypothetical protein